MILPCCNDALVAGDRVILAGKGDGPGGLLPPQAPRPHNKGAIIMNADHLKQNLPMHPPRAAYEKTQHEQLVGVENV